MGVVRRKIPGAQDWEGADVVTYDKPTVRGVSKRVLIGPKDGAQGFAMRYFEVQPGGNSAHERHPETHQVFVTKGKGQVLIGETWHPIAEGDAVYIGPNEIHQLRAAPDEALGFL
ncbi:MAG: cupin domain-containing protein [Candidatus Methylomirabilota bacterium]